VGCTACHAPHKAAGGDLTSVAGNDNLCASCHNLAGGMASRFPVDTMTKADFALGSGASHSWGVSATNAAAGAAPPASAAMSARLANGNVVCSTCHNQHISDPASVAAGTAGTQWTGPVTHTQGAGTGTVAFAYTPAANPKGYLVEIAETPGAAGTAKFRLSNDGGTSWWGWSGTAWVAYAVGNARLTSTVPVALNDGTNATVTFTGAAAGSFVASPTPDRYRSYVNYPFLRAPLDAGSNAAGNTFCRDCHAAWAMDHAAAETYTGGVRSHPVGEVLNANGAGYDRTTPLDGDGTTNDGNPSNDLKLGPDNTIQCYTCHGMHHSPSNTAAQFTP
jgi:predicted CXXCH cytochrome family protein